MKRALIIVADPNFSFKNANSAVARYLLQWKMALENNGWMVDLFPDYERSDIGVVRPGYLKIKLKKIIKRFFPTFFERKRFKLMVKAQRDLIEKLVQIDSKYNFVLELAVFGSDAGFQFKKRNKCGLVIIYDSPLPEQYEEFFGVNRTSTRFIEEMERKNLSSSDYIVCYSNSVAKYLLSIVDQKNIKIIPCIIWKDSLPVKPLNDGLINIGFIGSFLKWHRVDLLVDAFEKIAEIHSKVRLILVGFGQEWFTVKRKVDASKFRDRIKMTGFVSDIELENIKSQISIGVMPGSNWYGSPLKLFEYAEAGIPIIGPSTPTVLDHFESNKEILYIDSNNQLNSLISHLETLISNKNLRRELSQAALKLMATKYSRQAITDRILEISNTFSDET